MRIPPTHRAYPAFPKSRWQNRDPENVPHVECPHLHCPPRLPAGQAVVVAKRHPLRHPTINPIYDEQRSPLLQSESAEDSTPSGARDSHSWLSSCFSSLDCPSPTPPSFAPFASRMQLRDRTEQSDFSSAFAPADRRFRPGRKCVGLRRETSAPSLALFVSDETPQLFCLATNFQFRTSFGVVSSAMGY